MGDLNADFDNNTWYQFGALFPNSSQGRIHHPRTKLTPHAVNHAMGDSSGQQVGQFNSSYAAVFGSPFSNTHTYQSWQIINSSSLVGAVVLRARSTGPYLYLNSMLNKTCDSNQENCTPCSESTCDPWLVPGMSNDLDAGAQWFIEPWSSSDEDGDGRPDDGYYMYNAANGSSYHLEIQDNGSWIYLNDNVTQNDNQSWDFPTVGSIDDETFSTVCVSCQVLHADLRLGRGMSCVRRSRG